MEIYMPLIAVIAGALTPVLLALYIAKREQDEQELYLVPLEQRATVTPTHERRPNPWPRD